MSVYVRKPARTITFSDRDGKPIAKLRITETGARGNAHFNPRRPTTLCNTPLSTGGYCGARWEPVCSNRDCPGNIEVRRVMRIEKYGHKAHERPGRKAKR